MLNFAQADKPRVLIIAMSGIGNLLMQTPLINQLKKANPTAEISVLVAPRGTKDVLENNPLVKNILLGSPKPTFQNRIGMIQAIQKNKFDVGIVAYPGQLTMSGSLLYFGSVPIRIGHTYDYLFLKNSGMFLNQAVNPKPCHDVQQNLNLLKTLGITPDADNVEYDFPLTEEDRSTAQKYLTDTKISDQKFIGLHPGTNADMCYKRWPIDRWAKLADLLADNFNANILLFGSDGENKLKQEIAGLMQNKSFSISLPLRGTAALIGKCNFFVSNDSGLMHVAVSQKVSTFGLFGPTSEERTAPWGKYGHVIRAAGTKPTYDVTKLKEIKKLQTADETLLALDTKTVFEEIEKTISKDEFRISK